MIDVPLVTCHTQSIMDQTIEQHRDELLDRLGLAIKLEAEVKHLKLMLQPPYWQCVCGVKAMPLTDSTVCLCNDYYDQEWRRVE